MNAQTSATAQKSTAPALTAAPIATIQRQCECGQHAVGGECEECKQKKGVLQRSSAGRGTERSALAWVRPALESPGQPLDRETRTFMESRFEHDFSNVRVHTGARAAESARALHANAWALGRDLVFTNGAYAPNTPAGRHLLAHELAHVVQQEHSAEPAPQTAVNVSGPGDSAEREAEAAASRVAEGETVSVHESADAETVHRDAGDVAKDIGIGFLIGAGVGLVALGVAALAGAFDKKQKPEEDDSKIDNPPQCGPKQNAKINAALAKGTDLIKKALTRLQAFKSQPAAAENHDVKNRLTDRFKSDGSPTVDKVERVIVHMQNKIASPDLRTECHVSKDDSLCANLAYAYVADSGAVVFCSDGFKTEISVMAVIHEMAHTVVGGARVTDRGYQSERIFAQGRLSNEEALTNAESYAEFIVDVATGTPVAPAAPTDVIDCPDDWKEAVRDNVARAERANTNILNEIASSSGDPDKAWKDRWDALRLPGTGPTLEEARKTYRDAHTKFGAPISFICKPAGGGACDSGADVDSQASPPALILCARWKTKPLADQLPATLAGLYGLLAAVDKADWRTGFAQIAIKTTTGGFAPPKPVEVFGNPAWSPDYINLAVTPIVPKLPKWQYKEDALVHERMSADLPVYQGPECHQSSLPFKFDVTFFVDAIGMERPGPFTPPRVKLEYTLPGPSAVHVREEDSNTTLQGPGSNLKSTLILPVDLTFDANGVFDVDIRLEDPDTGTVRRYQDQIQVQAVRPCPLPPAGPKKGTRLAEAAPAGVTEEQRA
jgi:hypothetical protein